MLRDFLWACRWLAKNRLFTLAIIAPIPAWRAANGDPAEALRTE